MRVRFRLKVRQVFKAEWAEERDGEEGLERAVIGKRVVSGTGSVGWWCRGGKVKQKKKVKE